MKQKLMKLAMVVGALALLVGIGLMPASVVASDPNGELILENKDASWQRITDDRIGALSFYSEGSTFIFGFVAEGLELDVDYSLIYYADRPDRFSVEQWGGDNPGALLGTGTSDNATGSLEIAGEVSLGFNLPHPNDANVDQYDYCVIDGYATCNGAKIWLVPTDCYDAILHKVITWSPDRFLFETDLITYQYEPEIGLPSAGTVLPAFIGATISPMSLQFGSVAQGSISNVLDITITNFGSVAIEATVSITNISGSTLFTDCLELSNDGITWTVDQSWSSLSIPMGESKVVKARLNVPAGYSLGTSTATVFFMIQAAQ